MKFMASLFITIMILLLVGCTNEATIDQSQQAEAERVAQHALDEARNIPEATEDPIGPTDEPVVTEDETATTETPVVIENKTVATEEPAEVVEELSSQGCTSTVSPQDIYLINVTTDGDILQHITRDKEGFTFRFFPETKDGEILPVEGNLGVTVLATEKDGNGDIDITEPVFKRAYFIKPENVLDDCGPKPITIKFSEIEKSNYYRYVEDDDMGVLRLSFKRSGSGSLYEFEIIGDEYEFSFMP